MLYKVMLAIVLLISVIYNIYQNFKIKKIKEQLNNIDIVLDDIKNGNRNRKILINPNERTSNISYKINSIIYQYEDDIYRFKKNDKLGKELMTSLSHDLRTPLTTLIGYLDSIDNGIVSGLEKEEYFQIARKKSYDLKKYIENLFELFKIESNDFTLTLKKVEITELTRLILRDWIPIFEKHSIEFEVLMDKPPIFVNLDEEKYFRLINNIIQNVIEHSYASLIEIKVNIKGSDVFVSILDNGKGINENDLPYIFDRLYKSNSERNKTSGLGLAITKKMVESMDGKIKVLSEENQYTKFIVNFKKIE